MLDATDIQEKLERHKKIGEDFDKYQESAHKELNKFYLNVAYIAGGAIILSVNLFVNVKDELSMVVFKIDHIKVLPLHFLVASWFLLLVSMISALYRNFAHTNYTIFSWRKKLGEILREKEETKLDLINSGQTILNPKQITAEELMDNIDKWAKVTKVLGKKEKTEYLAFACAEVLARTFFILGLIALVLFGVSALIL